MKLLAQIFTVLSLNLTACSQLGSHAKVTAGTAMIATEEEAIAVVLDHIRNQGDNPQDEECSAKRAGDSWRVTAWHIWYPENEGSSRFVPGGFTVYVVSEEGTILKTMPGH